LEAKRKDSLPLLPPFLLWRATKNIGQNWLEDRYHVTGEIPPFPDKEFLTEYMCSGEEILNSEICQK
jgi:hypothetical protein